MSLICHCLFDCLCRYSGFVCCESSQSQCRCRCLCAWPIMPHSHCHSHTRSPSPSQSTRVATHHRRTASHGSAARWACWIRFCCHCIRLAVSAAVVVTVSVPVAVRIRVSRAVAVAVAVAFFFFFAARYFIDAVRSFAHRSSRSRRPPNSDDDEPTRASKALTLPCAGDSLTEACACACECGSRLAGPASVSPSIASSAASGVAAA